MSKLDTDERQILKAFDEGRLKRSRNAADQIKQHRSVAEATVNKDSTGGLNMLDPDPEMMHTALLEVVDNQLREDDPPETRTTLERLLAEGHSELDAKKMIASVVVAEIFDVLKQGRPYDHDRYVAALASLPELPG